MIHSNSDYHMFKNKTKFNEIVKGISNLMLEPNPADPVVPEIASEFIENKNKYIATAKEWTKKYAS